MPLVSIPSLMVSYPGSPSVPNLVMWLKLNDASGTNCADSSGNANDGTITGTPNWISGGLTFDGSTNFITIANPSNFNFERTDSFTITAWINWDASLSGVATILNHATPTGNQQGYDMFLDATNSRLRLTLTNSSGGGFLVNSQVNSLPASGQHMGAVTYNGTSADTGVVFYIDGSVSANSGAGTVSGSILTSSAAKIGSFASAFFLKGNLYEVRVYNAVLSSGDISTLYAGGPQ